MSTDHPRDSEALRRFVRRVWKDDVSPLLRDRREQRRKSARVTGTAAAAAGLVVDGLFRLRGKPFTRFMTVVGSRLGALLPDVWDWEWLKTADAEEREAVQRGVERGAARLPEAELLELFELTPQSPWEDVRAAHREVALRWHPDRAPDDASREAFRVRFIAYQAAYERLRAAYDAGTLPRR